MVSRLIPSPLTNAYIDAFVPAVLWPGRAESIHLRTSAVLSRDPRQTKHPTFPGPKQTSHDELLVHVCVWRVTRLVSVMFLNTL
jgi:hypothetical protein